MPSKGGSRSTATATASASSAVASMVAPALASAGLLRTSAVVADELEVEQLAFVPELDEDPAAGSPEWADLYARAVVRRREERERVDRDASEAQLLWDEFLRTQGHDHGRRPSTGAGRVA